MDKIKDMLSTLKIPLIDDKYQFNALRSRLLQAFFSRQRVYVLRYRWAVSMAALLFLILAATFMVPNFASSVNTLVFGDHNKEQPIIAENVQKSKGILMPVDQGEMANSSNRLIDDDKTYLIRQYNSPRAGKVMVVSEYNKQMQNNKIRKVSAGCY
ncbi:MAG: hypothetical protein RAO94_00430 [Candidatus Stygibacter australis]|nr:hypothetical protein [Candidatus Stygibacter australis]MDP8320792.1 hypothetical protein [Candidatus Stygibacter australis]